MSSESDTEKPGKVRRITEPGFQAEAEPDEDHQPDPARIGAPDGGDPQVEVARAEAAIPSPHSARADVASQAVAAAARALEAARPRGPQRPRGIAAVPPPETPPANPAPQKKVQRRRKRRDTLRGVSVQRVGIRTRAQRAIVELEKRAIGDDSTKLSRLPVHLIRVCVQVLRQWARDRCPQQAASLAFQTVLSIVPMVAVTLAALRASGSIDAQSAFVDYLASELIPVSRETIAAKLVDWSKNITFESMGLIGIVTIGLLAFVLINSLEKVINHIWRSERHRSLSQKFVVFYAAATIGPFLFGLSVYQAAQLGLTDGFSGFMFGVLTSYFVLFLANYFLPAGKVRVRSALVGAAVSAILFELAKVTFSYYVETFASAKWTGIYGAVAIGPLLLLWIYWSWLVFLLGVEVAHAWQNLHLLRGINRRGSTSLENELLRRVNGVTAARLMVTISENYLAGRKVTTRASLEERYDLSDDILDRIMERLKQSDLVIQTTGELSGYVPGRPPTEISLADVFGAFRGDDFHMAAPAQGDLITTSALDKVLREIEADTRLRTAHLNLDELV